MSTTSRIIELEQGWNEEIKAKVGVVWLSYFSFLPRFDRTWPPSAGMDLGDDELCFTDSWHSMLSLLLSVIILLVGD